MSEDAADALEGAIEEAKAAGNMGRANSLYQRQLALEAGVPVVLEEPEPEPEPSGEVALAKTAQKFRRGPFHALFR